jgi:hypothetical protein
MITHAIPGRIRLRHPSSPTQDALDELMARIRALAPSATIEHSQRSGASLIRFDETEVSGDIVRMLGGKADSGKTPRVGCAVLRWPSMGTIKRGMSFSLVGSLGLLAARREGGHALLGGIFLTLLARHVWVYRKRLWK